MFRYSRLISCALSSLALTVCVFAQANQALTKTGAGSVSGTVKLGDAPAAGIPMALLPEQTGGRGGRPAGRNAPPQQANPEEGIIRANTDDNGQYRFTNIAAGRYRVIPMAEAMVVTSSDSRTFGTSVSISEGQSVTQIDFALAPGGVINGRITDHAGRPVIAQRINLMSIGENGQPRPVNGGNRQGYETDDRGIYRAYGLPAGKYIVSAGVDPNRGGGRPGGARQSRYPLTYHPDVPEQSQATIIEVASGGEVEGIDIRLGSPLETYAVTGRVVDAQTGEPVLGVPINVARARGGPVAANTSSSTSDTEGKFKIKGLTSGQYTLSVRPVTFESGTITSSDYYSDPASFEISNSDASGVEVRVHRGASIAGTVVIEGSVDPSLRAELSRMMVTANVRSAQGQAQSGRGGPGGGNGRASISPINPDGSFRISGLSPGVVRLNVNGGGNGFSLARIEQNGAPSNGDIEVGSGQHISGVRIVVGYGSGVILGRVVIGGGTLPPGTRLMVTARPLNGQGQNRNAQVDASGQFSIEGLLSNTYEVRLISVGGGFGGGGFGGGQGGGQGGGRGVRGGGAGQQGGNPAVPAFRLPDVRQTVSVVNGSQASVTLNVNLAQ